MCIKCARMRPGSARTRWGSLSVPQAPSCNGEPTSEEEGREGRGGVDPWPPAPKTIIRHWYTCCCCCCCYYYCCYWNYHTNTNTNINQLCVAECSQKHPCEGLNRHAHFRNFGVAFLTLFRVATGDNWNGIMKVRCRCLLFHCLFAYLDFSCRFQWKLRMYHHHFIILNLFRSYTST